MAGSGSFLGYQRRATRIGTFRRGRCLAASSGPGGEPALSSPVDFRPGLLRGRGDSVEMRWLKNPNETYSSRSA